MLFAKWISKLSPVTVKNTFARTFCLQLQLQRASFLETAEKFLAVERRRLCPAAGRSSPRPRHSRGHAGRGGVCDPAPSQRDPLGSWQPGSLPLWWAAFGHRCLNAPRPWVLLRSPRAGLCRPPHPRPEQWDVPSGFWSEILALPQPGGAEAHGQGGSGVPDSPATCSRQCGCFGGVIFKMGVLKKESQ